METESIKNRIIGIVLSLIALVLYVYIVFSLSNTNLKSILYIGIVIIIKIMIENIKSINRN